MKDKWIQIKVAQSFKDRLRECADKMGLNISSFVISAINEKIERSK